MSTQPDDIEPLDLHAGDLSDSVLPADEYPDPDQRPVPLVQEVD